MSWDNSDGIEQKTTRGVITTHIKSDAGVRGERSKNITWGGEISISEKNGEREEGSFEKERGGSTDGEGTKRVIVKTEKDSVGKGRKRTQIAKKKLGFSAYEIQVGESKAERVAA